MRNVNQDLNRLRQPNVLPIFGQLEVLSGKSRFSCPEVGCVPATAPRCEIQVSQWLAMAGSPDFPDGGNLRYKYSILNKTISNLCFLYFLVKISAKKYLIFYKKLL